MRRTGRSIRQQARTALALALLLAGCSSAPRVHSNDSKPTLAPTGGIDGGEVRQATPGRPVPLTHEEALIRAHQVAQISYNLWLGLNDSDDDYDGRAVINFVLRNPAHLKVPLPRTLFLDFASGAIRSLRINDVIVADAANPVRPERYDGQRIHFNLDELQSTGVNRIEVTFSHEFSRGSRGLQRFRDPADGATYLYSRFEPYAAREAFPCFDQPDLKASFEITVETPETWEVISSTPEREISKVDGRKSWAFPPSPLLSTDALAIHAGPYHFWKTEHEGIPLRLFARRSLAHQVDFGEWFEITRKGLETFSVQFGTPFPFAKYDQVLIPDFLPEGLKNAAAPAFSDSRFVAPGSPGSLDRRARAVAILRKVAQMWLGDLVSPRWWNGQWLNESFATFMALNAMEEPEGLPSVPKGFAAQELFARKARAYADEAGAIALPLESAVADTDQALARFESLPTDKGAALLKQLRFHLGEEDFREGVQRFFQKYALRSASAADFFRMLSEASGKDLTRWQKSWLQAPGVNTVRTHWSCGEDGRIERFEFEQLPPEDGAELRPRRTRIALYTFPKKGRKPSSPLKLTFAEDAVITEARTTLPALQGKPCPDLVVPNQGDFDYVRVELDARSLITLRKSLGRVESALDRQLLWSSLWEMVLSGKFPATDYVATILESAAQEKNPQTLATALNTLIVKGTPSSAQLAALRLIQPEERPAWRERAETWIMRNLRSAPAGSDLQKSWWEAFLNSASTPASVQFVSQLLAKKATLPGFRIDQTRRWELLEALARNSGPEIEEQIATELKQDSSENGQLAALIAQVSIPDMYLKRRWLSRFVAPESVITGPSAVPMSRLRLALPAFHSPDHEELIAAMADAYFQALPRIATGGDPAYAAAFAQYLFPPLCRPESLQAISTLLKAHPELPPEITRHLKVHHQEEERCMRLRSGGK